MEEIKTCHYCSGSKRYKPYPTFICSGCRRIAESFDVDMTETLMAERNAGLDHQEEVEAVFKDIIIEDTPTKILSGHKLELNKNGKFILVKEK